MLTFRAGGLTVGGFQPLIRGVLGDWVTMDYLMNFREWANTLKEQALRAEVSQRPELAKKLREMAAKLEDLHESASAKRNE
jgi:hypothetical protein